MTYWCSLDLSSNPSEVLMLYTPFPPETASIYAMQQFLQPKSQNNGKRNGSRMDAAGGLICWMVMDWKSALNWRSKMWSCRLFPWVEMHVAYDADLSGSILRLGQTSLNSSVTDVGGCEWIPTLTTHQLEMTLELRPWSSWRHQAPCLFLVCLLMFFEVPFICSPALDEPH